MNIAKIMAAISLILALLLGPAAAQSYTKASIIWLQQGKISGGISVSNSSAATALPAAGFTAWICNTGTNDAFLAFGGSAVVATATGSTWLKAGTCGAYDLNPFGALATYVAAITASSTTTLAVETGIGTPPVQPGSGATTITGTVTSNQGTANTATNGWPVKITDGTSIAAVKAASTAPVATDPSQVVSISQNTGEVGVPGSGISQPAAGVGISGWLSGIYNRLAGIIVKPTVGTGAYSAVTVGASSAQALAAATATLFLDLKNESTTASIACAFGAVAALNTAGSFTLPPGANKTWENSFVPTDAVNCIASAGSTPMTIGVK